MRDCSYCGEPTGLAEILAENTIICPACRDSYPCYLCGSPATRWAETLSDGRRLCPSCRPCVFFENYLTLTGDYAGEPFKLMPWFRKDLRAIFGTLDDDGTRRYRDV